MTDSTYKPDAPATNPIGYVGSWLGNLFRPRSPDYVRTTPQGAPVANVKGIALDRAPVIRTGTDGVTSLDPDGSIIGITLVVADDAAAETVLAAIRDGTPFRVLAPVDAS